MKEDEVENDIVIASMAEEDVSLPQYASEGASGADVRAHLSVEMELLPGESALIPTGLHLAIPEGYEIQVRPRSGLALKHQITVLNAPGTIDSDYRGEIKVIMINHGREPFVIMPGMRIAQFVLCPVVRAQYTRRNEHLPTTSRGAGGFGHTGIE